MYKEIHACRLLIQNLEGDSIFQKGFFERVTTSLNTVTPERCRIYFRSVRRYLELYAQGVEGKDIPEAMRLARKHRKHRGGTLHEDDADSQRGKKSRKESRIKKLKAVRENN